MVIVGVERSSGFRRTNVIRATWLLRADDGPNVSFWDMEFHLLYERLSGYIRLIGDSRVLFRRFAQFQNNSGFTRPRLGWDLVLVWSYCNICDLMYVSHPKLWDFDKMYTFFTHIGDASVMCSLLLWELLASFIFQNLRINELGGFRLSMVSKL